MPVGSLNNVKLERSKQISIQEFQTFHMIKNFLDFISNINRRLLLVVTVLEVLIIGVVDFLIPTDINADIFYLIPILTGTWYVSQKFGMSLAVISSIIIEIVDRLGRSSSYHWGLTVWNAIAQLIFFLVIVHLLSLVKQESKQLEELATLDPLTGISNRRAFNQLANMTFQRSERQRTHFAAAYIDLDDFKIVNDTYGHSEGDRVLQHVATIIQQNTRNVDTVARMGGDEFIIMLPDTDEAGSHQVINRIKDALHSDMAENGWPVTFSIGGMNFPRPPASVDDLVDQIDTLMYSVKNNGKDNIAFERFLG